MNPDVVLGVVCVLSCTIAIYHSLQWK